MMLYPPVQQLLENIDNRYLLVNVVSRRARQISLEAEGRGEMLEEKPISIAIDEVADGRLTAKVKGSEAAELTAVAAGFAAAGLE